MVKRVPPLILPCRYSLLLPILSCSRLSGVFLLSTVGPCVAKGRRCRQWYLSQSQLFSPLVFFSFPLSLQIRLHFSRLCRVSSSPLLQQSFQPSFCRDPAPSRNSPFRRIEADFVFSSLFSYFFLDASPVLYSPLSFSCRICVP